MDSAKFIGMKVKGSGIRAQGIVLNGRDEGG